MTHWKEKIFKHMPKTIAQFYVCEYSPRIWQTVVWRVILEYFTDTGILDGYWNTWRHRFMLDLCNLKSWNTSCIWGLCLNMVVVRKVKSGLDYDFDLVSRALKKAGSFHWLENYFGSPSPSQPVAIQTDTWQGVASLPRTLIWGSPHCRTISSGMELKLIHLLVYP